jgi:hypothetical protein
MRLELWLLLGLHGRDTVLAGRPEDRVLLSRPVTVDQIALPICSALHDFCDHMEPTLRDTVHIVIAQWSIR